MGGWVGGWFTWVAAVVFLAVGPNETHVRSKEVGLAVVGKGLFELGLFGGGGWVGGWMDDGWVGRWVGGWDEH